MAIVIPYVKQTWVDGSTQASAARFGVLEEGVLDVSLAPCVRVFHNTTQLIANNTTTSVAFNSERFDQAGGSASTMHDNVTNNSRLTAIYAGVYQITGNINWPSSPANAAISIKTQGTTEIARNQVVGDYRSMSVATLWSLAVNEYVELQVIQVSGAGITIAASSGNGPEFMMVRVG